MKVYLFLLFAGIIQGITLPANINKAKFDDRDLYLNRLSRVSRPPTVVDSSINGYTLWTQQHECIGYSQIIDGIQIINVGRYGGLHVHQASGDLVSWIHDSMIGFCRYPTSITSGGGSYIGPHICGTYLIAGTWGGMAAAYEIGGWYSSQWSQPVDLGPGNVHTYRNIGKQLANGNILFIGLTTDGDIIYRVYTPNLSTLIAQGTLANSVFYWGYDVNGGIACVFYHDASLNVYFKTTIDGISWGPQQTYNIIWPNPYPNNLIGWTQMALTDMGNPILVFDNWNADDSTYPYYSKVYVSYQSGQPCVEVSSAFGAPDTECFYPTIATGGNKVAVLYCAPRNNEPDSLTWWDFYVNWSTDNGVTWGIPVNCTQPLTNRPGLPQLAKRIDTLRSRFYYVYAIDMIENHDPLWHVWFDPQGLDPIYICFDYAPYTGIEESDRLKVEGEGLALLVLPSVVRDNAKIQYTIPERQRIRLVLYDILGRKIKTIAQSTVEPGIYSYRLDSSNFSAGVYFLLLQGERESRTRKVLITR